MLQFLQRLLPPPHPLSPSNLGTKIRDIVFRVMEDDDIDTCISFYRANEAKNFPPGLLEFYSERLRKREFLTLIALRSNRPVGCCGIYYSKSAEGIPIGFFCYGMVDPNHHRTGIGTAQLLVRLALLPLAPTGAVAAMAAVPNSIYFYQRFGFEFDQEIRGADGGKYPLGLLKVSTDVINQCREFLAKRNITYPDVEHLIPHQPQE